MKISLKIIIMLSSSSLLFYRELPLAFHLNVKIKITYIMCMVAKYSVTKSQVVYFPKGCHSSCGQCTGISDLSLPSQIWGFPSSPFLSPPPMQFYFCFHYSSILNSFLLFSSLPIFCFLSLLFSLIVEIVINCTD